MLSNPTTGRRLTGRADDLAAVAVALPLTATRAIDYVDVLAPDASSASPVKAPAPVLAGAGVAGRGPTRVGDAGCAGAPTRSASLTTRSRSTDRRRSGAS